MTGVSPEGLANMSLDVQTAVRTIIERAILDHPRSAQVQIGASEIGTPCTRKLAFKLSRTGRLRAEAPAWRPTVGTAMHTWMEKAFAAENKRLGWDRWLIEHRVEIGDYGLPTPLGGHCDIFDRLTGTVLDWKFPGVTTIKKAKAARHPGETYRVQAHCYGRGWERAGHTVRTVAVYFLPAAGELSDGYYWHEAYQHTVAIAALARAQNLVESAEAMGGWANLIPMLPTVNDYCAHCPWWRPGSDGTDGRSCPGELIGRAEPSGPAFGIVRTVG